MERYKITNSKIVQLYASMVKIRRFEERIVKEHPKQQIKTPVHLYIGQEAIAAGVCAALTRHDYVFGTHRSHGIYIAKGGNLKRLAAELYGSSKGCAKGKGGSMHVVDNSCSVAGTTAIVAANIALAVGAGLTISLKSSNDVSCAFFGDGAVDEGTFYESLNFAVLKKLPVIFICENNFYATHSHVSKRQPFDNICSRGSCFGMPGVRVDGNDVLEVFRTASQAVKQAREGAGPSLIECRTYRWKTHVGPDSDADLGTPPGKNLKFWMKKCPIENLRKFMVKEKIMDVKQERRIIKAIDKEIEEAFDYGKRAPAPKAQEVSEDVFG